MNKDFELTLLSEGQIWGTRKESQLYVMERYGIKAAITDLCILTGCCISNKKYIDGGKITGRFWTKSKFDWSKSQSLLDYDIYPYDVCAVDENGEWFDVRRYSRQYAVRPVLQSSFIFSQIFSKRVKGYNGIEEVEYGEYPQWAADPKMQKLLELEYSRGMYKTGESYTFDSAEIKTWVTDEIEFKPETYDVYEYLGRKYIRVKANFPFGIREFTLSNNKKYKNGDYVWVEVSPVKWLIDEKTHTLISKYGLVSGIKFQVRWKKMKNSGARCDSPYVGDFNKTEMYEYLNQYMAKDLFQSLSFVYDQDMYPKEKGAKKKLLFFRI